MVLVGSRSAGTSRRGPTAWALGTSKSGKRVGVESLLTFCLDRMKATRCGNSRVMGILGISVRAPIDGHFVDLRILHHCLRSDNQRPGEHVCQVERRHGILGAVRRIARKYQGDWGHSSIFAIIRRAGPAVSQPIDSAPIRRFMDVRDLATRGGRPSGLADPGPAGAGAGG